MNRLCLLAVTFPALLVMAGCSRQPLPANQNPPKDQADLEARYERLEVGIPESEITAFMGKAGAAVAGYSTQVVKRKPEAGGEMAAGDSDKHWASADGKGAIRVVFGTDGRARLIQLLRLRAMGPPDEPKGP